jgi:predicted nuclease with RNAse H fold
LPQRDLAGYEGTLESMYHDPAILALHLADLQRLVDYCRNKGIDLIVITFPHLARPAETAPLLHPIVESLRAANVPVIEVAPLIAGRDPRLFYNNRNDTHPNVRMNALLTDAVMRVLSKRKETR